MNSFYPKVVRLLEKHGFYLSRSSKHETWKNSAGVTVTVTRNLYAKPTAERILKDAGIDHRLL